MIYNANPACVFTREDPPRHTRNAAGWSLHSVNGQLIAKGWES